MDKGTFCISIDLELLWGRTDKPNLEYFKQRIPEERMVIDKLLTLFKKYDIPATWATVGKMQEKKGSPEFNGMDIIKKISKLKNQEIGSHSYSHPEFTKISRQEANYEFNKFKKTSFVFPRNKIKYLNELKNAGFKIFRSQDEYASELLIPRVPPVYALTKRNGIVSTRGSMYFVSGRGWRKYIPQNIRYIKSKLGIDSAIKNKMIFHIWFHPIDFVDDQSKIFSDFEAVLKYAKRKRDEGFLDIKSMRQLVQQPF